MSRIETVKEIVETIGRERLMQITGLSTQSVSNAIRNNRLPPTTYAIIVEDELARQGLIAPRSLFGQKEPPERVAEPAEACP